LTNWPPHRTHAPQAQALQRHLKALEAERLRPAGGRAEELGACVVVLALPPREPAAGGKGSVPKQLLAAAALATGGALAPGSASSCAAGAAQVHLAPLPQALLA
jgi:hypothetical protein